MAREAKKQAEAQKPTTSTPTEANESATNNTTEQSNNTGYFILGIGGLIVSGLGVYYQHEAIMRTLGRSQKPPTPAESNTVVEEPKRKGRICEME